MAIKGKSKSRGAKTVARGPKPVYVPVKTPWYRRKGLWIIVATVLAVMAIEGLVYGFANERNDSRDADEQQRLATTLNRYRGELEPVLATVGNVAPPSAFTAFADLATAISALEADTVDQAALDQAASAADATATAAGNAADKFQAIDASQMVGGKGFSLDFVLYVLNSRDGFARGARLYREAALLTSLAAAEEDDQARAELVARARGVQAVAEEVFSTAYSDYVNAQVMAGTFTPPGPISPLTGATGPVVPITGATGPTG